MQRTILAACAAFLVLGCMATWTASLLPLPAQANDTAAVTALQSRVTVLEAKLAAIASSAERTRTTLARQLAEPMILLVGTGPCPAGFTRINTRVFLNSRPRTPETGPLLDAAGIPDEEQPGVGYNVSRDFFLCFRRANSASMD